MNANRHCSANVKRLTNQVQLVVNRARDSQRSGSQKIMTHEDCPRKQKYLRVIVHYSGILSCKVNSYTLLWISDLLFISLPLSLASFNRISLNGSIQCDQLLSGTNQGCKWNDSNCQGKNAERMYYHISVLLMHFQWKRTPRKLPNWPNLKPKRTNLYKLHTPKV